MAVRASVARVASIDPDWVDANVVARRVEGSVPAMPITDWQLMQGARERAFLVQESLTGLYSQKSLVEIAAESPVPM